MAPVPPTTGLSCTEKYILWPLLNPLQSYQSVIDVLEEYFNRFDCEQLQMKSESALIANLVEHESRNDKVIHFVVRLN